MKGSKWLKSGRGIKKFEFIITTELETWINLRMRVGDAIKILNGLFTVFIRTDKFIYGRVYDIHINIHILYNRVGQCWNLEEQTL